MGAALADALITRLARQGRIRVRPTATALRFAGRDPEEAGREMAVDGVLTGSLQQEGKRLRVTAQLVPLTGALEPWAGAFEEELTHLFAVEDAVAGPAGPRARPGGRESGGEPAESGAGPERQPPPNLEAYQAYMKGRYFWGRLTGESLARAFACFQEAAEKDPSYAPPRSGLADGHLLAGLVGLVPPRQAWDLAEVEARAALERDERVAEAHVSLAYLRLFRDWDFAGAEAELRRALRAEPPLRGGPPVARGPAAPPRTAGAAVGGRSPPRASSTPPRWSSTRSRACATPSPVRRTPASASTPRSSSSTLTSSSVTGGWACRSRTPAVTRRPWTSLRARGRAGRRADASPRRPRLGARRRRSGRRGAGHAA